MTSRSTFVVVGAGLAGAKAAQTLREEGFDGRIVLLGAEVQRPYERPRLSKDLLRGESERESAFVHAEGFYDDHAIELRTGTMVVSLDLHERAVVLDGGQRIRYDRLLLATGAAPRRLAVPGAELDAVHELRTLGDCAVLRGELRAVQRLVVVGGGWIGCEVAACARQLGVEVTMIEATSVPLERALGREIGAVYRDLHAANGVRMLLGRRVAAFEGDGRVEAVCTADGERVVCDAVVVGAGAVPRTALARRAGMDVANGIVVDAYLQSSAPGVFAAGDVARAQHPRYGRAIRCEHWANALHQGPAAARNMLGAGIAYDRIPTFFSDQYDAGMEHAGHATSWDEVVVRGDVAAGELVALWLRDGRVLAGMNVNVWDAAQDIHALIGSGATVDPARLRDPRNALADAFAPAPGAVGG
ncbi:MAG TPA: FAD-dependent oxidoreductase [Solirubrobacteraceae bacterium]